MWQATALLHYNFSEQRDLTIHFCSALTFGISNDLGQTVPTIVKARVPVHQALSFHFIYIFVFSCCGRILLGREFKVGRV
jgi:hypothetical protein